MKFASPCGAVNMAGNAAEWTATVFAPYQELVAILPAEFGGVDSSTRIARPKGGQPQVEPESFAALSEEDLELAQADSLALANDPRLQFFSVAELQDKRPRVYRGGSINSYARFLRCANRERESPGARWYNIGFRCAKPAR